MAQLSLSFFSTLYRIFYSSWVIFFFTLCYPFLWFFTKKPERYYTQLVRLRKWIAVNSAFCSRIRFKIEDKGATDWTRNYVICANHSSNLDISAMMFVCQCDFSFMGKVELLDNPVTGLFFRTTDIPVDRSSRMASFKAFMKAKEILTQNKSLVIFPEGGIDDHFPPQLAPFKQGAFKLAIDAGVPILPVVIHDAWKLCWDDGRKYGMHPGVCHISILPAIEIDDFLDANELSELVFCQMQDFLIPERRNKLTKLDSN